VAGKKARDFAVVANFLCFARIVRLFRKKEQRNDAGGDIVQDLDLVLQRWVPVGTRMHMRIRVHAKMPRVVVSNRGLGVEKGRVIQDNASVGTDQAGVVLLLYITRNDIDRRAANMHNATRSAPHALTRYRAPRVRVSAVHGWKQKRQMPVVPPVVDFPPRNSVHACRLV